MMLLMNYDREKLISVLHFSNPSKNYGARKDLQEALEKQLFTTGGSNIVTHYLHDAEMDPIMKRIRDLKLENAKEDKVKLIYVPSYLNGNDGIFNLSYYDLLMGIDQTVFATYYEPWGYTPLESIAFGVPTVTTSYSGLGRWIMEECKQECKAISIIDRSKLNDNQLVEKVVDSILSIYSSNTDELKKNRENAFRISKTALWSKLISNYLKAYSMALSRVTDRSDEFVEIEEKQTVQVHEKIAPLANQPQWKRIIVRSKLPKVLKSFMNSENIW
jgi:phosphorylase/glycogen(starch) synthase